MLFVLQLNAAVPQIPASKLFDWLLIFPGVPECQMSSFLLAAQLVSVVQLQLPENVIPDARFPKAPLPVFALLPERLFVDERKSSEALKCGRRLSLEIVLYLSRTGLEVLF